MRSAVVALWLVSSLCWAADPLEEGRNALLAGDLARAEALFRQSLEVNPESPETLSNLAVVLSRREQHADAIELYRRALAADPALKQIHFNLAVAQLKTGRHAVAAASLREFLEARPGDARAQQLLGICLVETGEFEEAIEQLEAILARGADDPSVVFALAYAHARAGDEERGRAILARLEGHPAEAALVEGWIAYRQERFQAAKERFEESLRHNPKQPAALAALGRLHLLENDDAPAIDYLERALQLAPHDSESTYQLGVLYARNGRLEEGRELLHRAAGLRANYADPYYQLASLAYKQKEYDEALGLIEQADGLLPGFESIRFLKGRILQALGRSDEARKEFEAVRRIKAETIRKAQQRVESGNADKP
jgi:tetratricopeptide (TPR) repeat protein